MNPELGKSYMRIKSEAVSLSEELRRLEQGAARYERLKNDVVSLRAQVAGLEARPDSGKAFKRLLQLSGDVPEGFTTRGTFGSPGGYDVASLLTKILGDAVAEAERREEKRAAALAKARADLDRVERTLAEEFGL